MTGPYDDIIGLPHHVSPTRPRMSRENRAAQFAPFAALTGYEAAVRETARLTDKRIELDENAIALLDRKLSMLAELLTHQPEAAFTYFLPDKKKEGGAYVTVIGAVKRFDDYEGAIVLTGGEKIRIADVLDVECELFRDLI